MFGIAIKKQLVLHINKSYLPKEVIGLQIMGIFAFFKKSTWCLRLNLRNMKEPKGPMHFFILLLCSDTQLLYLM